jgi:hypothetical protein
MAAIAFNVEDQSSLGYLDGSSKGAIVHDIIDELE